MPQKLKLHCRWTLGLDQPSKNQQSFHSPLFRTNLLQCSVPSSGPGTSEESMVEAALRELKPGSKPEEIQHEGEEEEQQEIDPEILDAE